MYEQTNIYMDVLPPLLTADRSSPTFRPVDGSSCLASLVTFLSPIMGRISQRRSSISCLSTLESWKLITEFTFERRRQNLCSFLQFKRMDDTANRPAPEIGPAPFPRSLFALYGLYNVTRVGVESEADTIPMAKAMAKLAEHFVSQSNAIFSGLGVND
jgi:hypothetical protein